VHLARPPGEHYGPDHDTCLVAARDVHAVPAVTHSVHVGLHCTCVASGRSRYAQAVWTGPARTRAARRAVRGGQRRLPTRQLARLARAAAWVAEAEPPEGAADIPLEGVVVMGSGPTQLVEGGLVREQLHRSIPNGADAPR